MELMGFMVGLTDHLHVASHGGQPDWQQVDIDSGQDN